MVKIDLTYPSILDVTKTTQVPGRTESRAFLLWFLLHYYRLEEIVAYDTVCDGPDDKGIDGLYVDENLEIIDIFQCKLVQKSTRTLGDAQLKEFVGTLAQFEDPNNIADIASNTSNKELESLLTTEHIAKKLEDGYKARGIFVTNIARDDNADTYLQGREDIVVFDKPKLESSYISVGPAAPMGTPVALDVFGFDCSSYQIGDINVIVAPVKGSDLIQLDGIVSNEIFSWNVRGSLGRTKVNKDIGKSIDDQSEHKNFLLYHNGLTILCQDMKLEEDKISISGYSVVNGCQSLTSLYAHRSNITNELRILTKIIKLPPEHELAEKITHRSNNQNPINARDLQSNSIIQRRLQNEFFTEYAGDIFYRIKRGEPEQAPSVIDNDEAGRLLLAFDLKQPWTCHQSYKVLDELHSAIFARPEVNAHRIVAIHDIQSRVVACLNEIESRLLGSYRLMQYFLLYLVRCAMEVDDRGQEFCADPYKFISENKGRERLRICAERIIRDIIIDLNAEVKDREQEDGYFDYKRELKSQSGIHKLTRGIIPQYQKAVVRKRANSFGFEWEETAK